MKFGSKQKGPAKQVAPRVSSLKICCRFWVCVFPIIPWRESDFQRPLFGGDFLGQVLAADSLPGAFLHSREVNEMLSWDSKPRCLQKWLAHLSGKKKVHKQKIFLAGDLLVWGQSPGWVARAQRFMCYPRNPRNIRPVTGVTGWADRVLRVKVLCAFSGSQESAVWPPTEHHLKTCNPSD